MVSEEHVFNDEGSYTLICIDVLLPAKLNGSTDQLFETVWYLSVLKESLYTRLNFLNEIHTEIDSRMYLTNIWAMLLILKPVT